jgi:hypothetical protein
MDTIIEGELTLRDQKAYRLAMDYLLGQKGVKPDLVNKYLKGPTHPQSLPLIYKGLLITGQNTNMMPQVIGKSIGGIDSLEPLLCGFEPRKVVEKYEGDWELVLDDIISKLNPRGKVRKGKGGLWTRYCKTITSGAAFLSQFDDAVDFYKWVDFFDNDKRARPALPMLLSYEIDGLGFPLACDFLKEMGYLNFGKPDVHIKIIFVELSLCWSNEDYKVFKAICRVAKNVGVTPYNVDKLFWLVASGNFYLDGINIGQN